ncbi:MAG TPA: hypothetical protein VLC09_13950 [Polyangiaceae bacterium]|nr:hypothetical protein [Polyangiaceae bacterium]
MPLLPTGPAFHLVERDRNHRKAVAFNMLFMIWQQETTYDAMKHAATLVTELGARYPEGIGVMQVVDVGSKPPDAGARAGIAEFLKTGAGIVKHSSVIHEGQGFGAAAVRAVMASIHMLHRPKFAHSTFGVLSEALAFHTKHQVEIGRRDGADAIRRAYEQLRSA